MPEIKYIGPLETKPQVPQRFEGRVKYLGPLQSVTVEKPKQTTASSDGEGWFKTVGKGLVSKFYDFTALLYEGLADAVFKYSDRLAEDIERLTGLPKGGALARPAERYIRGAASSLRAEAKAVAPKKLSFIQELVSSLGAFPAGAAEFVLGIPYAVLKGYEQGGVEGMIKEGAMRALLGRGFEAAKGLGAARGAVGLGLGMGAGTYAETRDTREAAKEFVVNAVLGALAGKADKLTPSNRLLLEMSKEELPGVSRKAALEKKAEAIDRIVESQPEVKDVIAESIKKRLDEIRKVDPKKIQEQIEAEIVGKGREVKSAEESAATIQKELSSRERLKAIDELFDVSGKRAEESARVFENPEAQKQYRREWARKINDAIEQEVVTRKEAIEKIKERNLKLMEIERKEELSRQQRYALEDEIEFGKRYAKFLAEEMKKGEETSLTPIGERLPAKTETARTELVERPELELERVKSVMSDVEKKLMEKLPPEQAVRQVARDRVENPLVVAERQLKKGRYDEAIESAKRAQENGAVLEKADGPITEEMVQAARQRAQQIIDEATSRKQEELGTRLEGKLPEIDKTLEEIEASMERYKQKKAEAQAEVKLPKATKEEIKLLKKRLKEYRKSREELELEKLIEEQKREMKEEEDIYRSAVDEITMMDIPEPSKGSRTMAVDEAIREQWKIIDRKLGPDTLRSGLDPTIFADVVKLARLYVKKGVYKFEDWASEMLKMFGDSIVPYLDKAWKSATKQAKETLFKNEELRKFGDPSKVVKQRKVRLKDGTVLNVIPVTEAEASMVLQTKELPKTLLNRTFETPIYTFEKLDSISGTNWKETLYRPYLAAMKAARLEYLSTMDAIKKLKKGLRRGASKRIYAYAVSKQEGGLETLREMGIEVPKLTKKEMQVYEAMRKVFDNLYSRINRARELAGKEPIEKIEDYFTFSRVVDRLDLDGLNILTAPGEYLNKLIKEAKEKYVPEERMSQKDWARVRPRATSFKFVKRFKGSREPFKMDAFGTFRNYTLSSLEHIYLSPVIAKGREMIGAIKLPDGNVVSLKELAPRTHIFLEEWLDAIAGKKQTGRYFKMPQFLETRVQRLNRNLAFAILSANTRSFMIQPAALANTVGAIGFRSTIRGIEMLTNKELRKLAMEKSDVLISREYDIAAKEAVGRFGYGLVGKAKEAVGAAGLKPLQYMDKLTATATWLGALDKAKKLGLRGKEAYRYADDIVTKTQGSAQRGDLAPIQRTALGKAMTLFQTFTISQWNFLAKDVFGKVEAKKLSTWKDAAAFIVASALISTLYEEVAGVTSPLPTPLRAFYKAQLEDKGADEAAMIAAKELLELVPVVGGSVKYGTSMLGAPFEYMRDISKTLSGTKGIKKPLWFLLMEGAGVPGTAQLRKTMLAYKRDARIYDMIVGTPPNHRRLLLEVLSE